MSLTSHRPPVRAVRTLLRALLLAIALSGAAGAGIAAAGTDSFCNQTVGSGSACSGPNHSLTASRGWNNSGNAGCGGAVGYYSYYCASPAGCHTYGGSIVLTPGIRHRSSSSQSMSGYSTWGSTAPPSYCDPGSVYAVGGPIDAAASSEQGIPVLDQRRPVNAPAAVGFAAPSADLTAARAFDTPAGQGWVLVDGPAGRLCVLVDDHGSGYGYSCQRLGNARAYGSLQTLEDEDQTTATGDVVIALAPAGVDALQVERTDGTTRSVPAMDGVVVTTLTAKDRAVSLAASPDAPAGTKAQRRTLRRH